jgi:hypothetical protein
MKTYPKLPLLTLALYAVLSQYAYGQCYQAPAGIASWWPGENSPQDVVGGAYGTCSNISYTTGKVGDCFTFNGTNSAVLAGNSANLECQTFTIEGWVQRSNTNFVSHDPQGNGHIFGWGDGGWGFAVHSNGTFLLTKIDYSEGDTTLSLPADLLWHHVAVTFSYPTATFYRDGTNSSSTNYYPGTFTFGYDAAIGARSDNLGNSFCGNIDEFSVYTNVVLTASQISNIWYAGSAGKCSIDSSVPCSSCPANLVSWWKGENNLADSWGDNNGLVLTNAGYTNGEVGMAFAISGTNGAVMLGSCSNLQLRTFTIEGWIQRANSNFLSGDPQGNGHIFGFGSGGYGFALNHAPYYPYPVNSLMLTKIDYSEIDSYQVVRDTYWHHVAVVVDSTVPSVTFYLDGATDGPQDGYNPGYSFTTITNAAIGARSDNDQANSFCGNIDELSVYNRALSGTEISNIYAQGVAGKCGAAITNQPSSATAPPGVNVTFSVGATASSPMTVSYQWQFNGVNIANATNSSYTVANAGLANAGSYSVIVSDAYSATMSSNALLIVTPFAIYDQGVRYPGFTPQSLRLSYWKFDGGYTNQNNIGPTNNINTYLSTSNNFSGTSVSLSESTANLTYPLNLFNCSNGTVRFWYQPNWSSQPSNGPSDGVLINVGGGAPDDPNTLYLQLHVQRGGNDFLLGSGSNQVYVMDYFTPYEDQLRLQQGLWCQIALTYSPSNVALYTNGALYGTVSQLLESYDDFPGSTNVTVLQNAAIGLYLPPINPTYNSWFAVGNNIGADPALGQIDELETFNYPLTAQQIAAGFPTFGGQTTNTTDNNDIGVSDMMQTYVYGTSNPNPQVQLGYWRFDSPLLYAEQGQMPLWANNVSLSTSWSGTALNVSNVTNSGVAYPWFWTNGWENINCRNGTVLFWYKPNTTGTSAPLIYLGNHSDGSVWMLAISNGNTLSFVTATNSGSPTNILSASSSFSINQWTQIALTYGPSSSSLYINGANVTNGAGVPFYPTPSDRALGMVIGNNTMSNSPANAQFDEIQTFNYQLSALQILTNYQTVTNFDRNLDGIPDILEEIVVAQSSGPQPYLGAPVVVTAAIEAEQFDQGGPGVAYHVATNATSAYRQTGMNILSCNDLGGGYCIQQSVGDWADYAINVLVAQPYVIEARVAGLGTGGAFGFGFSATPPYTNNFYATNTNSLVIQASGWTNISCIVNLSNGVNEMRLSFLTNGTNSGGASTGYVGQFNYISIYPYWPPPTNGPGSTNLSSPPLVANSTNWTDARGNATLIQNAIDSMPNGGTVVITNGTYYVAEPSPDEIGSPWNNAAVTITKNNVAIVGTGTNNTNTTLIGFDRGTTLFLLGVIATNNVTNYIPCTNFILSNLTIEAQPHMKAVSSGSGYTTTGESNGLFSRGFPGTETGASVGLWGLAGGTNYFSQGILITNCQFLYGDIPLAVNVVSNLMVAGCNFTLWGGTNTYNALTDPVTMAILGNGVQTNWDDNFVIINNTFNGNANLGPTTGTPYTHSTYNEDDIASEGFIYIYCGGNFFVARNTILNYQLEAIHFGAGPNAIVGNTFFSLVSDAAACAARLEAGTQPGVTGDDTNLLNFSSTFVGNSVYGGRHGVLGAGPTNQTTTINVSGNTITNYPPFNEFGDGPGAAVTEGTCRAINIFGNTLGPGGSGYGFACVNNSTNIIIANNDFSRATFGGIEAIGTGFAQGVLIASNVLSQGINYHGYLLTSNAFSWFLYNNQYVNTNNVPVPPVIQPEGSAVHVTY